MRSWLGPVLALLLAGAPAAAKRPPLMANKPVEASVPFDLASGRPTVMAQIGKAAPMAVYFDTGSTGALIPRALVTQLGLKEIGETQLASPFGGKPVAAKLVSLGRLVIDGVAATDLTAVVQEDASFMGADARLVIGPVQFANKVIVVDYPNRTLRFRSQSPFSTAPWQPLKDGLLETDIVVAGQRIPLHIDSGSPGTLMLPSALLDQLSPRPVVREVGRARTVDKEFTISAGTVGRDAVIAGVPVTLGDVAFADLPWANLGSEGLSQFLVVIDPARQRWQLIAPERTVPRITLRPRPQ